MVAAKPNRMNSNVDLPHELCREILSRLPAKSILRFRSVCKSWYSLVSCPDFISDHSVVNINKNDNRILLQPYDNRINDSVRVPFSSHDGSFMESREHDEVPEAFLGNSSNVRIVGSCNGLICLSKRVWYDDVKAIGFLIWNPTIRKVVELPSLPYYPSIFESSYVGFGFDFKTGDYKVMIFGRKNCDGPVSDANVCEIFDLSKGVWRVVSPLVRSWFVRGFTPKCYLDGAVHWTGHRKVWSSDRILLSFDMSDEVFREIRMPDWTDDDESRIETRSVTLGGLIHVIVWKLDWNNRVVYWYGECSVWAMKEYGVAESWTKMFNIDLLSTEVYHGIEPSSFHFWEDGEVLMVHDFSDDYESETDDEGHIDLEYSQELLMYNMCSRKCKQLFSCTQRIKDMCVFKGSLVLM